MQALYVMNSQSSVCVDVLVFVGAETWNHGVEGRKGSNVCGLSSLRRQFKGSSFR